MRARVGYTSLKTLYMEEQARNFPSLKGTEQKVAEINEDDDDLLPMNPIEQKDKKIASLLKDLETTKAKDDQINSLKEALTKSTAELKSTKKSFFTIQQKLNFTKKATENSLVENISNPNGYIEDPVLIGVYSATLNEEEIDDKDENTIDEKADGDRSRKDNFLKSMEEKIDLENPEHKERYLQVKNRILEKVKATKVSRSRSRSNSFSKGVKRGPPDEPVLESQPVRAKSGLPVKA